MMHKKINLVILMLFFTIESQTQCCSSSGSPKRRDATRPPSPAAETSKMQTYLTTFSDEGLSPSSSTNPDISSNRSASLSNERTSPDSDTSSSTNSSVTTFFNDAPLSPRAGDNPIRIKAMIQPIHLLHVQTSTPSLARHQSYDSDEFSYTDLSDIPSDMSDRAEEIEEVFFDLIDSPSGRFFVPHTVRAHLPQQTEFSRKTQTPMLYLDDDDNNKTTKKLYQEESSSSAYATLRPILGLEQAQQRIQHKDLAAALAIAYEKKQHLVTFNAAAGNQTK